MGIEESISYEKFPEQGEYLGKKVEVCFNYDTSKRIQGRIVRDDMEEPFLTIIELNNGRYITSTECQYKTIE